MAARVYFVESEFRAEYLALDCGIEDATLHVSRSESDDEVPRVTDVTEVMKRAFWSFLGETKYSQRLFPNREAVQFAFEAEGVVVEVIADDGVICMTLADGYTSDPEENEIRILQAVLQVEASIR